MLRVLVIAATAISCFFAYQLLSSAVVDSGVESSSRLEENDNKVNIYSATDTQAISPIIRAFEALNQDIDVRYYEYETTKLYRAVVEGEITDADVVISSAMDLQVKLVNYGFALPLVIQDIQALPSWSHWRNEAFGFTYEPVVFVYNKEAFKNEPLPDSHEALVTALRLNPEHYAHRIGTYDIGQSGAGYLFATQDVIASEIAGRIREGLARAPAKIYCCTSDILDEISTGDLVFGYNLIGSYALARAANDERIGVILPADYTLVMTRIAFIPKMTNSFDAAQRFVRFLISAEGQKIIAQESNLISIHPDVGHPIYKNIVSNDSDELRFNPIKVSPSLLTFQDHMKRESILREWSQMFLEPSD